VRAASVDVWDGVGGRSGGGLWLCVWFECVL
jgi:hypothetical protein